MAFLPKPKPINQVSLASSARQVCCKPSLGSDFFKLRALGFTTDGPDLHTLNPNNKITSPNLEP